MHSRIKIFIFLFVVLLAYSFADVTQAITVTPVRIEITGDPGQTIVKPISLINEQDVPMTFYSSFANFESQGESGNPAFVEPKSDLGTWMHIDETITLAPKQTRDVYLTIDIPKDAYAGGHFAVVFFGNNPKEGGQVSVGAKTGTLILLSVNGDVLEAGGVTGFKTKNNKRFYNSLPVSFEYKFKNDGNDRVKPAGNIVIHNAVYYPTEHINANAVSGNILPHSTRLFNVDWIENPRGRDYISPNNFISKFFDNTLYQWNNFAIGPYIATLDLIYGTQGVRTTESTFFFVFPWQLLICILFVFTIVYFVGRKLLVRYNRYIIKKARAGMKLHDASHE